MAANRPLPHDFPVDGRCVYHHFSVKPEGKVPCVAIGKDIADGVVRDDGEIVGITFQEVAVGRVRPVLPIDNFTKVEWTNAPASPANQFDYIDVSLPVMRPAVIPPQWEDFAKTMRSARQAMLNLMTPQGEQKPELLLKAFQNFTARNPKIPNPVSLGQVVNLAERGEWTDNRNFLRWVRAVTDGCIGTPTHELACCLEELFPACQETNRCVVGERIYLKIPPTEETSQNSTISRGVPHCLVYGYDESQVELRPVMKNRPLPRNLENRSRPRHRVLVPKELGHKARSRSRSPVEDSNNVQLVDHVNYVGQDVGQYRLLEPMRHMLDNPEDYLVKTDCYFKFFEPHKPDLTCLKVVPKQHGQQVVVAKFICEISSWNREAKTHTSIEVHVQELTEQCVKSCLAALACNQDSILGICVFVDGLKLIKIEKSRDVFGRFSYHVRETLLIPWDDIDDLYALLEMIRKEIELE